VSGCDEDFNVVLGCVDDVDDDCVVVDGVVSVPGQLVVVVVSISLWHNGAIPETMLQLPSFHSRESSVNSIKTQSSLLKGSL